MSVQSSTLAVAIDSLGTAASQSALAEAQKCPICGMHHPQPLCVVDGFQVLRCAHCASDFVWPAPDEGKLQAYYDRAEWFEGGERGGYSNYDEQTNPQLHLFETILDTFGTDGAGRSVLDIGCGYGTHLEQAHRRGWKCFGVEVSAHAREVISTRHDNKFFISDDAEQLIPHEFDLIVLFDVIEHLVEPYKLFFTLFAKGAITPKTTVIIATPNARSASAVSNPATWAYRHPPSHLVYFSGHALTVFLRRLHFDSIEIHGAHEEADEYKRFPDESYPINDQLASFAGLICKASGSDFAGFMQERYVPGTWSRIAEYEHLPRYLFARDIAAGRRTMDFGCGTGYGTALLAQKAESVVGIDIDVAALEWAREHHKKSNLSYDQRADFGASLPDKSFQLITCFEMIEHVAEAAQREAVVNFSRLLTQDGLAIISTPNPEITKLYGANPYHIREMNKTEFKELLHEYFQYVEILEQYIQPSVLIAKSAAVGQENKLQHLTWGATPQQNPEPAVYIALCSHVPIQAIESASYLDVRTNFIKQELDAANQLNQTRFNYLRAAEQATSKDVLAQLHASNLHTAELEAELNLRNSELNVQNLRTNELEGNLHARNLRVDELEKELHARNLRANELESNLHARNLANNELESAVHSRNLRIVELETDLNSRNVRIEDLEKIEKEIKAELARYNWIRKIDRFLIKR
jgi:2-polyprenyl-3-methyl-5-hydroxy-6-metoxy-1,4-benzoquinol methylase